jgi:hypothetical protein
MLDQQIIQRMQMAGYALVEPCRHGQAVDLGCTELGERTYQKLCPASFRFVRSADNLLARLFKPDVVFYNSETQKVGWKAVPIFCIAPLQCWREKSLDDFAPGG